MIKIHYNKKRFEITCPFHSNDIINMLPSRRWQKTKKIWVAPAVRMNIEVIQKWQNIYLSPEAEDFLKNYSEKRNFKKEPFPMGYNFKTDPRNYQSEGMNKLWPIPTSALFMDPGTGKTKMAIDMATARYQLTQIKQVLVIGLVSIKTNWEEEILKHCPIDTNIHILMTSKKGKKIFTQFCEENTTSFKWLITGVESLSTGSAYGMVKDFITQDTLIIVDESSKIKSHKAIRTNRVIELGLMDQVKYKMILTGTPVTQGVIDLFSQFEFLDSDIIGIGNFYAYRNTYCIMGGFENRQIFGYKNIPQLTNTLDPYIYQVRKKDVLTELPEYTREIRRVPMTSEQKTLYKELKTNLKIQIDNEELTVLNVMNLMQRFSEITGGHVALQKENPDPLTRDKKPVIYEKKRLKKAPKLEELVSILESMPKDEQFLIWSPRLVEIDLITERLNEIYGPRNIGVLTGRTSEEDRQNIRTLFQEGEIKFIVGNPMVGGIGLNLTAARYVFYYSRDFSLEISIQSEARVHRIGQKRAVTYYDIVCEKTIDEHVLNVLMEKEDFAEVIRSAFRETKNIVDFL